jgi:hypothetical protein
MALIKILLVGVFVAVMLVVARDQQWFERSGLLGHCSTVGAPLGQPSGGAWYLCSEGIMTGFPALGGDSCDSVGFVAKDELWHCPAPLESIPGL